VFFSYGPTWLRLISATLLALVVVDIATGGEVLAWVALLGLVYLGCLLYARRKGLLKKPAAEIAGSERPFLDYLQARGPSTERELADVAPEGASEHEVFDWARDAESRGLIKLASNGNWELTDDTQVRLSKR
jgi:hypothetical protein